MEAYARPIRALGERLREHVSRPRGRLVSITTDALLRDAVVELAMGFEHHAENVSPFVRFDEAFTEDGACWDARAASLRASHEERRAAMEPHGYALPALGPASAARTPLARFAATLAQVLDARCEPLRGLVVVLAPGAIASAASFERDLRQLASAPELARVRWIVIEQGASSIGVELARSTGAERLHAEVDEGLACRELEAKLDAAAAAPADAAGPAQVGAPWPRGARPPGARGGADGAAKIAASLGLPAGLLGGALREVRGSVLRGALALRRGDPVAATRHQSRAVQACAAAGLDREACLMDMVLATYLVHAGERDMAEGRYRGCAERARDGGWHDLAAQSLMAAGSLRVLARDRSHASVAYAWAGRVAREGSHDALAIEGFRMAGQLAADDGNGELAGRLWAEAIAIATGLPEPAAGRTSAPLAARQLAEHCARMGLSAQAQSLRAQADRMETAAQTAPAA